MVYKVTILGSGCAGSTAAIYAARANLQPLVFEGYEPGGQLSLTTDVENYPGFPEGILGPDLVDRMKQQAERFGAVYRSEQVEGVDFSRPPFELTTGGGRYRSESVIIAAGASARLLGLDSERRLIGHGVSTCATCDGFFFREKDIVVVGGGDSAMEEALYLTKYARRVTVIHRRNELRASKIMTNRALNHEKISFLWDTVVNDILDAEKKSVEAIRIRNVKTGREEIVPIDGVFIAIGHRPNTGFLKGQLELDEGGYLKVFAGSRTSVEGVFAAGDVHDLVYRQAVTAAGAGCRAAIDAEKWLEQQEHQQQVTAAQGS